MQQILTSAHLFCGGGGDADGANRAGFNPIWAVEKDFFAAAVFRKRFSTCQLIEADIRTISDDAVRCLPVPDILIAGFPCQDLSLAGNRKGFAGDRSSLFFEFVRFLRILQPSYCLAENVFGLLNSNNGADFEAVLRSLAQVGYLGIWQVRNGRRWVPQNRQRVFIVGTHRERAMLEDRAG